jgi:hypothetical protein
MPVRRSGATFISLPQKIEAQPIGISAAPNSAGQARGEGKDWPARHDKRRPARLFLLVGLRKSVVCSAASGLRASLTAVLQIR